MRKILSRFRLTFIGDSCKISFDFDCESFFCRNVLRQRFTIISKNLLNKENDNEKFSDFSGRTFCDDFGEKSNVKMGRLRKDGGGGSFTEES
jgi:hypothetical protein